MQIRQLDPEAGRDREINRYLDRLDKRVNKQ